jgi:hypothetical protein
MLTDLQSEELGRTLKSLTEYRRRETASLAATVQLQLGVLDGIVGPDGLLARRSMRPFWDPVLDGLQQTLAASKENGEQFSKLLETIYGTPTAERLRLLLGRISEQRLVDGMDQQLVDGLTSDVLLERILSARQLRSITGKSMGYTADDPTDDSIRGWRKLQSKAAIRYATPPTPFN